MDFYKVPIGFGMALAQNFDAMAAYAAMTDDQKQAILNKATMQGPKRKCTRLSHPLRVSPFNNA